MSWQTAPLISMAIIVAACRAGPSCHHRPALDSIPGEYRVAGYPELDLTVNSDMTAELKVIWRTDKTTTASYKGALDRNRMTLVAAQSVATLNIQVAVVEGGLVLVFEDFEVPGRVPYLLERKRSTPPRT